MRTGTSRSGARAVPARGEVDTGRISRSATTVSPYEALIRARERFEGSQDLTVAVEEEFQILDPVSLDLTSGYERLSARAAQGPLREHLAGELIASEIEVKTGRCETFADAA